MRRTLEDIIPPSRRHNVGDAKEHDNIETAQTSTAYRLPHRHFAYVPALIALIIIGLSIGALFIFSGSKVEIEPMSAAANLDGSFTASASTTSTFPFAIVSVEKLASQTVTGNGTNTVHTIAKGKITVYNTRARVQKLITKTRFETKSGLVFKINTPIVVPAAHGIIPGTITVSVYAAQPGAQYNIGPSSFNLPGLAGTSLASDIYGRSTTLMSGGFSGTQAEVSSAVESATRTKLRTALVQDLMNAIKTQVPSDYVLLNGAATTTYTDLPNQTTTNTNMANLREQGTMTAVIFPMSSLAKAVAGAISGAYSGQPVTLVGTRNLTLTPADTLPTARDKSFYFTLSGNTTVVWSINPNRIATAIAGKTLDQARTVIKGFPEIKRGYITLRPFWKTTLPNDPSQISVVINKPQISTEN